MRSSQTYGDKQREAQRRKKQEELFDKLHPENAPTSEPLPNDAKPNQVPDLKKKKNTSGRRSA
jgi:hypothetical protein